MARLRVRFAVRPHITTFRASCTISCGLCSFRVSWCHNQSLEFDWDDDKAEINIVRHGISFLEATSVFDDDLSITFLDPDHSIDEERLIIIGHSNRGRLLFVSHTDRNRRPRIISAREVTRRERKVYEDVR